MCLVVLLLWLNDYLLFGWCDFIGFVVDGCVIVYWFVEYCVFGWCVVFGVVLIEVLV